MILAYLCSLFNLLLYFKADMIKQIQKPEVDYIHFIKKYFGPFGVSPNAEMKISPVNKLSQETKALLNQLNEKVEKRKGILKNNLRQNMKNKIR